MAAGPEGHRFFDDLQADRHRVGVRGAVDPSSPGTSAAGSSAGLSGPSGHESGGMSVTQPGVDEPEVEVISAEVDEDAVDDGKRPRVYVCTGRPLAKETEEHRVSGQFAFRSWCWFCVEGSASGKQHGRTARAMC